jgi:hypothetical protein
MADLDIMKALKDPKLQFQTLSESRAADVERRSVFDAGQPDTTVEEPMNDFDPEQYVEATEAGSSLPLPQVGPTHTSGQEPSLCVDHINSSYAETNLELLAIENWMELLQTQTKSCIFLARGNWQARQAGMAIAMAKAGRPAYCPIRLAGHALQKSIQTLLTKIK